MTYDEYQAIEDDIIGAFKSGEITEWQLEREMEMLQNQWNESQE